MSNRLSTTPAQIHDAVESHIPHQYRAKVITIFADLASDAPVVREDAIIRGHRVASELKSLAESQNTPGLYSDAEPSACLKVSTYIYAAMDAARQKSPAPYSAGALNNAGTVDDTAASYAAMLERDANALKGA